MNRGAIEATLDAPASRRRRVLRDESIAAAQRRHFVLFDIIPTAGALAAIIALPFVGVSWIGVSTFTIMWILNLVGIEVGYHRLFSHGAFDASPRLRAGLVILGSMGAQGPVVSWASNHRHHHQHSDTDEDTHSPHAGGFWHSHLLWKWSYPYPSPSHYTPGLLRDPVVIRTSRRYTTWIALGLIVPAIFGAIAGGPRGALEGFLCGGVLRLVIGQHATWCINSLCHLVGTRPFRTGDRSTNNAWLALPTLGGSWHNNHHAFPTTASNQLAWYQLDPCYWIIRVFARCGAATNVKVPTRAQVDGKRRAADLRSPRA
ncbi:MAG TPA: fatty acid desaturase [Kofleriaceae bacterium]|nr:fatty acid desaturase [Kofleriaceae bacterium]